MVDGAILGIPSKPFASRAIRTFFSAVSESLAVVAITRETSR